MNFYIVIPAHNEESYLGQTLQSLVEQTLLPKKIVVVDDHSTDTTAIIAQEFSKKYPLISIVQIESDETHQPGSKVIHAFYKGFESLDENYDVICKFDADLIFPKNYLETLAQIFLENPKCGMASGLLFIEKNNGWVYENLTSKNHIRGALKTYTKNCFECIGKIKPAIGWDTADELLAQYHGFEVIVTDSVFVKHLKPTGKIYHSNSRFTQGKAMYSLRYGLPLTILTGLKMAFNKKRVGVLWEYIKGYFLAKSEGVSFLVSEEEGKYIRDFRWKNIRKKIFLFTFKN